MSQDNQPAATGASDPIALWVIPASDLGGVARHVLDTAAVGIPGFRLVVLCPPGPFADALAQAGVDHLVREWGPDQPLRTSLSVLRSVIRQLRPAIVHSHLAYADIALALVAGPRRPGRNWRVVTTEHGIAGPNDLYHSSSGRARLMALAHSARRLATDRYIAVAQSTAEQMRAKWQLRGPIDVIPNGVDPAPQRRRKAGWQISSIARLAPEKRIDALIDAFSLIHSEHPQARLTIAGTGECERELRAQVASLGLLEAVDFAGYVDAPTLLARTDVLVQLSCWENCSYTLLDALNAGVPVVATAVGGNPEIVPAEALVSQVAAQSVATAIEAQRTSTSTLPANWPSRAQMTAQVAALYRQITPAGVRL